MTDLRVVEKLVGTEWKTVKMANLIHGDVFRMFECDGEPVGEKWIATSNAKPVEGVWGVECKEYV